jgi:multidrug efflux pump subunit AcrB
MLRAVTRPIESSLRGVPGVREMRSTTSRGSAEFNLDCEWGSNMDLTPSACRRGSTPCAASPAGRHHDRSAG